MLGLLEVISKKLDCSFRQIVVCVGTNVFQIDLHKEQN